MFDLPLVISLQLQVLWNIVIGIVLVLITLLVYFNNTSFIHINIHMYIYRMHQKCHTHGKLIWQTVWQTTLWFMS